jgi:hypothetical protein
MPGRTDAVEDAFISPDDPIPERKIELIADFLSEIPLDEAEEGEVVGMDLDAHIEPAEVVAGGDPHVVELIEAVSKLAESLNRKGEAGLRAKAEMSRFEATLRSYCVGYLAGRRAEDPVPPAIEEALSTDF